MNHEFGWLPEAITIVGSEFRIEPLPDLSNVVKLVRDCEFVEKDWFYPPPLEGPPVRAAEYFQLPATHQLQVEQQVPQERVDFLIAAFGFLMGLRIVPARWIHFYRAYLKPHVLVGFYIEDAALTRILELAWSAWAAGTPDIRKMLFGALHWHMFSRSYEHAFEVFNAQYTVLDTCWRIHSVRIRQPRVSHAKRIVALGAHYRIPLPAWAAIDDGKTSYLSRLRNSLIHEGFFAGEPIAFGHPREHPAIHLELFHYNTRLLLALLGEDSWFVHSALNRSMAMIK